VSNSRGKNYGAGKALDGNKNTYWATAEDIIDASLTIDFGRPTSFNRFLVQEYIALGQRVKSFKIEALVADGTWKELDKQTTIGYKRILVFPTVRTTKLRFTILDAKRNPVISNIGVYLAPQILIPPTIVRNQSGTVSIHAADEESTIYYTVDGTTPTLQSKHYTGPFKTDGKLIVQAVAFNSESGKSSPASREEFDLSRKDWKILNVTDPESNHVIDGNPNTTWSQKKEGNSPIDITIDMGRQADLNGFRYLPGQDQNSGLISAYQFFVSTDNENWILAHEGEFSNIKNSPLWQNKHFKPVKARYIRLRELITTDAGNNVGYAELDVTTL
jgi:alpha-L-fucosidase